MASPTDLGPADEAATPQRGGLAPGLPAGARRSSNRGSWTLRLGTAVVAVLFAVPLTWLVLESFGVGGAAQSLALGRPLLNSVLLASSVAATTAVMGTAAAWVTMRTDVPLARLWRALLPLPLVIPSFIGAFTLLAAFAPGGLLDRLLPDAVTLPRLGGFWGAYAVLTLLTYPYVFLPVSARLRQLPASLEESARLLGRGGWTSFVNVVLPQTWSAVLAGGLLVFLYTVSDFGAVQLLRYDTLTRVIYASRLDPPTSLGLSLQLALVAVVVVAAERLLVRRTAPSSPRAARSLRVSLGRWRPLATIGVSGLVGFALLAPVSVLVFWAARGIGSGSARTAGVLSDPSVLLHPLANTALAGMAAAVTAVVAVLPVAYLSARHRDGIGATANGVVVASFALPGLVIALSLVTFALAGPEPVAALYQSLPLLVFAYVIHFGAQSLRAAQVAVANVPPRLGDAARTLGAGTWRRLVEVELPIMLPGLAAGAGLVLLSTMKELPATLLLAPPGFSTLATRIWSATEDAFWSDASLGSLVLILLSGVLTWVLVIRRYESLD